MASLARQRAAGIRALGKADADEAFVLNAARFVRRRVVAVTCRALAGRGADGALGLAGEAVDLLRREDAALLQDALLLERERGRLLGGAGVEALGLAARKLHDFTRDAHGAP